MPIVSIRFLKHKETGILIYWMALAALAIFLCPERIAFAQQQISIKISSEIEKLPILNIEGEPFVPLVDLAERCNLEIQWDPILGRLVLLQQNRELMVALVDSPVYRIEGKYTYQRFSPRFHETKLCLPLKTVKKTLFPLLQITMQSVPAFSPTPVSPTATPSPIPVSTPMEVPTLPFQYSFPVGALETPIYQIEPYSESSPGSRLPVIVLDPGQMNRVFVEENHSDSLPLGDLTYDLAVLLKRKLEKSLPVKVVLTRDRGPQPEISAEQRAIRANSAGGDLFLSFRLGGGFSDQTEGYSVFYMTEIADDREPLLFDSEGRPRGDWAVDKRYHWDSAYMPYLMKNEQLARIVRKHLNRELRTPERGMRAARLTLLRSVQMPAVWIELGVLTHRQDRFRIQSSDYQERLVNALFFAVQEYLDTIEPVELFF